MHRPAISAQRTTVEVPSRVWSIPELVVMILELLSRSDQASMASLSQRLWEIAITFVWASLSSTRRQTHLLNIVPVGLKNLLEAGYDGLEDLPVSVTNLVSCFMLTTLTTQLFEGFTKWDSWARYDAHAPLVKSFDVDLCDGPCDLGGLLAILHHLNKSPIFPNLKTLSVSISANFPYPLDTIISSVFCPNIQALHLEIEDAAPHTTALLAATHKLQLDELEIRVRTSEWDDSTTLALADAIAAQNHLKRLRVYDTRGRMKQPWTAASNSADLEEVTFMDLFCNHYPFAGLYLDPLLIETKGFRSLRSLAIDGTAANVSAALNAVTSSRLTELEIMLQVEGENETMPLSNFDGAIKNVGRFTGITCFQIAFPTSIAAWDDFLPLLACRRMEDCVLSGLRTSCIIGDQELLLMAQAWPQLRSLVIDDYAQKRNINERTERMMTRLYPDYQALPPKLTLGGLKSLAVHTPLLRRLCVAVDARSPEGDPDRILVGAAVETLELAHSWTNEDSAKAVASFICRAWPHQTLPSSDIHLAWMGAGSFNSATNSVVVGGKYGPWSTVWGQVYQTLRLRRELAAGVIA